MTKNATRQELKAYANRMQEIVYRTRAIGRFRQVEIKEMPWVTVEVTFLQLRQILELVATALLTVNQDAVSALRQPGARSWHALDILRAIEDVNEHFYPKPSKRGREDMHGVTSLIEIKGGFLTKDRFISLYRRCGQILHTRNPFDDNPSRLVDSPENCPRVLRQADQWLAKIIRLLTHHEFRLKDDKNVYVAYTAGRGLVFHVARLDPIGNEI